MFYHIFINQKTPLMNTTPLLRVLTVTAVAFAAVTGTQAALVHSYDAADAANTNTSWNDSVGSVDAAFSGGSAVSSVSSANTVFTNAYTVSSSSSRGDLGTSYISGTNLTLELWFRRDLDATVSTPQILFDGGGASSGFSLLYQNTDGLTPELRVMAIGGGGGKDDFTLSLSSFDDTDFIMSAVVFDDANDLVSLYASGAAGGSASINEARTFTSIAGNDNSNVFGSPQANTGGNNGNIALVSAENTEIALFNIYNNATNAAGISTLFNAQLIPEPGTSAMLLLGGAALFLRRNRRK